MQKLVLTLGVVLAVLFAVSPAWSARGSYKTSLRASANPAPQTVFVVLCADACETGGTLCPGIYVNDVFDVARGSCETPYKPVGFRVYAVRGSNPNALPPQDIEGQQAAGVTVKVGNGK